MKRIILSLITLFLVSCFRETTLDKIVDPDKEQHALSLIDKLRSDQYLQLKDDFDSEIYLDNATLEKVRDFFPEESEISKELINYSTHVSNQRPAQYTISHQFEFPDIWIVTTLTFKGGNDGEFKIQRLHVTPLSESIKEINKFTFTGKSWIHYLTFALCVIIPAFIIYTLVIALKSKTLKKKWLWVIFILTGIVSFNLNWTSGQFNVEAFRFLLLGSGYFSHGLYGPLIFSVSLPIGALMFWLKKGKN